MLNVFTSLCEPEQDIVVRGKRIAWVGPSGQWKGRCASIFDARGLWAALVIAAVGLLWAVQRIAFFVQ